VGDDPQTGRVVVFDGTRLHGVVPGRGDVPGVPGDVPGPEGSHRATLMIAFWDKVKIRRAKGPGSSSFWPKGSARPFPPAEALTAALGGETIDGGIPVPAWPSLFMLPSGPEFAASCAGADNDDDADDDDDNVRKAGVSFAGRETAATPVRVWEDVDAAANGACMPSLLVDKIQSLPPIDACFMF
jgi:hypothetical protein